MDRGPVLTRQSCLGGPGAIAAQGTQRGGGGVLMGPGDGCLGGRSPAEVRPGVGVGRPGQKTHSGPDAREGAADTEQKQAQIGDPRRHRQGPRHLEAAAWRGCGLRTVQCGWASPFKPQGIPGDPIFSRGSDVWGQILGLAAAKAFVLSYGLQQAALLGFLPGRPARWFGSEREARGRAVPDIYFPREPSCVLARGPPRWGRSWKRSSPGGVSCPSVRMGGLSVPVHNHARETELGDTRNARSRNCDEMRAGKPPNPRPPPQGN